MSRLDPLGGKSNRGHKLTLPYAGIFLSRKNPSVGY
jgi:hypothetical protein